MRHTFGLTGGRLRALAVLAGLLALLLTGCDTAPEALAVGADAPDFTLSTFDGQTIALDDYQGNQPVLLYFHMAMG